MSGPGRLLPALLALGLAGAPAAWGHGASRGLHLGIEPDPARPGQTVTLTVDCEVAMTRITAALHGAEPVTRVLAPPARRAVIEFKVPATAKPGQTLSFHATAVAGSGHTYRASGVLRVAAVAPPPPDGPKGDPPEDPADDG